MTGRIPVLFYCGIWQKVDDESDICGIQFKVKLFSVDNGDCQVRLPFSDLFISFALKLLQGLFYWNSWQSRFHKTRDQMTTMSYKVQFKNSSDLLDFTPVNLAYRKLKVLSIIKFQFCVLNEIHRNLSLYLQLSFINTSLIIFFCNIYPSWIVF